MIAFIGWFLLLSTIIGLFMLVEAVKEERAANGYVAVSEFLLMILMCLVPFLNWVTMGIFLTHAEFMQRKIFVRKT